MLSVIVIVKNEAHYIQRCLASVQWADEIIVLDSGSTDNTVALAQAFTKNVFCTDWPGYGIQKQRALDHASGDWVLNLDADETVDHALKKSIMVAMQDERYDAYRVPIRMCFEGKSLRFSSSPTRHVRLFKRAGASFSKDIVHEKIKLPSETRVGQLKAPLWHDSFQDLSHAIEKMNRYSSYSAKIRLEQNRCPSLSKTLLSTTWMFVRCYFIQGGFLDGRVGLLFAVLNAEGAFFRGMKQIYPDKRQDKLPCVVHEV
jgi:glycosyltransferase involved in cell wall biosynthesis